MPSNPKPPLKRSAWILAGIAVLSVGVYLLASGLYYRIGLPLDDSWIHQTYARNLAQHGEWAFLPGQPSGGSTAPLWSALLAIGCWLQLTPYVWTYALGAAALWILSFLSETAVRNWVPAYQPRFPWVGVSMVLEWHLVWAAGSGMETLLYSLLATLILVMLASSSRKYFGIGLLAGLSVWTRPDGVTLLAPAVLVVIFTETSWTKRIRSLVNLGLGFGSLFVLYLLFNLTLTGSPWPNTFYAKQAEYAILQQIPFWKRLVMEALQPLVGVGIVLLPGVALVLISAIRRRSWGFLAGVAWFVGYLGLYAWRLPVTYQHARYIIPAMPSFFLLGLAGLVEFVHQHQPGWRWIIPTFWKLVTGLILVVFWGRGAFAYAQDVAFIESEMVATARWVSSNLPPDALVAAHDIGALGYFGGHALVDLAGLVSPEVIPFIRDESRIKIYLDDRHVDYLVTFPDWYQSLTLGQVPVFTTGAPYGPTQGQQNMAVYRWQDP